MGRSYQSSRSAGGLVPNLRCVGIHPRTLNIRRIRALTLQIFRQPKVLFQVGKLSNREQLEFWMVTTATVPGEQRKRILLNFNLQSAYPLANCSPLRVISLSNFD